MTNTNNPNPGSHQQAIADGTLIDITDFSHDAGFLIPVTITTTAWEDCVHWDDEDNALQGTTQDEIGRLWDVVWATREVTRCAPHQPGRCAIELYRIPRDGDSRKAEPIHIEAVCHPGDDGKPVLTIALPSENYLR
jgi:hypothetical protein